MPTIRKTGARGSIRTEPPDRARSRRCPFSGCINSSLWKRIECPNVRIRDFFKMQHYIFGRISRNMSSSQRCVLVDDSGSDTPRRVWGCFLSRCTLGRTAQTQVVHTRNHPSSSRATLTSPGSGVVKRLFHPPTEMTLVRLYGHHARPCTVWSVRHHVQSCSSHSTNQSQPLLLLHLFRKVSRAVQAWMKGSGPQQSRKSKDRSGCRAETRVKCRSTDGP